MLFCELCPFTYRLSMEKEILKRHLRDFSARRFSHKSGLRTYCLSSSITTNRSFDADWAM